MSDFRNKAREVYEQGVEERGNFTPTGTPLKIYQWWAKRSPNAPERENFCHFWRVVVIWAPLMWLVNKVEDLAGRRGVQVYSLLIALALVVWLAFTVHSIGIIAICLMAAIYAAIGFFTGGYLAVPQEEIDEDFRFNRTILKPVFVLTLPFALLAFGTVKLKRAWQEDWTDYLLVTLMGLVGLGALAILVSVIIQNGLIAVFILLGIVAGIAAIFGVGVALTTFFAGRRAKRNAAARAARSKALEAFWAGEGPDPDAVEPREPSKISKFFSSVLDFAILVGQIIRVKKWKICPTVEVPKEA